MGEGIRSFVADMARDESTGELSARQTAARQSTCTKECRPFFFLIRERRRLRRQTPNAKVSTEAA
jgi:hypothetical protein